MLHQMATHTIIMERGGGMEIREGENQRDCIFEREKDMIKAVSLGRSIPITCSIAIY